MLLAEQAGLVMEDDFSGAVVAAPDAGEAVPRRFDEDQPEALACARHGENAGGLIAPLQLARVDRAEEVDSPRHGTREPSDLLPKQRNTAAPSHDPQLGFRTHRHHARPGGNELLVSFVHLAFMNVADNQYGGLALGASVG